MKIIQLNPTDQLVKRCVKNDRKAQVALYQKMSPKMLGVCRRYTKSLEDAEEVLGNGFIKVFKNIKDFRFKGSFEGWVRKIMVNEAINFIRYQKNMFVEFNDQFNNLGHEQLNENLDVQELFDMINELPMGYRTVFNLYAIEGYPHKQIAEMLGVTESTSKSQLRKARKLLQEKIIEQQIRNSHEGTSNR